MAYLEYGIRALFMLFVASIAVRTIGKKSISEMTAYDLTAVILITTVAAEPLVYKIATKASFGRIFRSCFRSCG